MMKRSAAMVMMLLMMISCACAEILTDAPGTPTQDIVLSLKSFFMDEARTPYGVQVMQADQLTMDTVTDIFEFVYKQKNRAARYFPEETQQAIAEMYGIDPKKAVFIDPRIIFIIVPALLKAPGCRRIFLVVHLLYTPAVVPLEIQPQPPTKDAEAQHRPQQRAAPVTQQQIPETEDHHRLAGDEKVVIHIPGPDIGRVHSAPP